MEKNFHAWKKTPCEPFNVPRVLKTCPKVIRMAIIARLDLKTNALPLQILMEEYLPIELKHSAIELYQDPHST